jgi:hypothetical protein
MVDANDVEAKTGGAITENTKPRGRVEEAHVSKRESGEPWSIGRLDEKPERKEKRRCCR